MSKKLTDLKDSLFKEINKILDDQRNQNSFRLKIDIVGKYQNGDADTTYTIHFDDDSRTEKAEIS